MAALKQQQAQRREQERRELEQKQRVEQEAKAKADAMATAAKNAELAAEQALAAAREAGVGLNDMYPQLAKNHRGYVPHAFRLHDNRLAHAFILLP